jgi:hypothetical protein
MKMKNGQLTRFELIAAGKHIALKNSWALRIFGVGLIQDRVGKGLDHDSSKA